MENLIESIEDELEYWLQYKKKELLSNIDITIKNNNIDNETLLIMKSLIQSMKAIPVVSNNEY